jgi:hypothetical protein
MKLNKNIIKALYEAKEQKSGFTFDEDEIKDFKSFLKSLGFKQDEPDDDGNSFSYTYGFNFEEPYKDLYGKTRHVSASSQIYINFYDRSYSQSDRYSEYDVFCYAKIGSDDSDRDGWPNFNIQYRITEKDVKQNTDYSDFKTMKEFKNKIKALTKIPDSIKDLAKEYVKSEKATIQLKNTIKNRLSKFKK